MKPFAAQEAHAFMPLSEAAPARTRIRLLAVAVFAVLLVLAGRSVQLAFAGDPTAPRAGAAPAAATARADLVDRNGALLATTVRAYTLTARPDRVWNPRETATQLSTVLGDLDIATAERRMADSARNLVYVRRGLTAAQRDEVMALGLGGIGFETEERRDYPNGTLAGHALGYVSRDLAPLAGIERGLDGAIQRGGDQPVRLSLDLRIQYAAERELEEAARTSRAQGASVIVLDARSGETLALASWPALNPNNPGAATPAQARNRAVGERYEMGSTVKALTIAMALDLRLTHTGER